MALYYEKKYSKDRWTRVGDGMHKGEYVVLTLYSPYNYTERTFPTLEEAKRFWELVINEVMPVIEERDRLWQEKMIEELGPPIEEE